MFRTAVCSLVLSLPLMSASVSAQTIEAATERTNAYLDRFEGVVGPGFAVVIVTAEDVLINRSSGVRRASTGAPMTAGTPMYIASQTKAFMGLVAAALDERGILPLDTPLNAYWPDLVWPEGVDPSEYTLRDLLTHEVPFENGMITFLETNVMQIDPADYPGLIEQYSQPRDPGYVYDNLGYNIYAAILETATGRSWRDWLDEVIFDPLGMDQTSSRMSDFTPDEVAWGHIWLGEEEGWFEIQPKTDAMMQSAGGLVISPNDMATWLQLQLRGDAPEAGLTASMLETTHTAYAQTGEESGRNIFAIPCSGYSLGWNTCEYRGFQVLAHGGTFTGTRSLMAWSPDAGVGIAVFSNSDNVTMWWAASVLRMYLEFLAADESADRAFEVRVQSYSDRTAGFLRYRQNQIAQRNAEDYWGGWTWQPSREDLTEFAGIYASPEWPVETVIALEEDGLVFRMGDRDYGLRPARPDLFADVGHPLEISDPVDFQRDDSGEIISFTWDGVTFTRR